MNKDNSPRSGRPGAAARGGSHGGEPLDQLRAEIDAAIAEPASPPDQVVQLNYWVDEIARSGVLRRARLSSCVLAMLAEVLPPASITAERRLWLERQRLAYRAELLAARALEAACQAESPADLFCDLRKRADLTVDRVAGLFGVSLTMWTAVELKKSPWYRLRADAVPAFAAAVREPVDRLLALIALTARRAVLLGIERRAGLALGRCDNTQAASEARRDTLRMAFARVADENRGAAAFLTTARRAAGDAAEGDAGRMGPDDRSDR